MHGPLELRGRVEAVLIGGPSDRHISWEVKKIQAIRGYGIKNDRHAGSKLADSGDAELFAFGLPRGLEVANYREFSAVSMEELAGIARLMKLPRHIPLGCLGENLVLSGIPELSQLPPGTLLFFQTDAGEKRTAVLMAWKENLPCTHPGKAIQQRFSYIQDVGSAFPKVAMGKRGIVGSVYSSGFIHRGDTVVVKVPRQNLYIR